MREKTLNLLGLMRKANAIAIGETNTGAAVRSGNTRLLLVASDASENAWHRAEGFAGGRDITLVRLPFLKEEISAHVGVSGCSMAAVMDIGFANAFMKSLAMLHPEEYGEAVQRVEALFDKTRQGREQTAARRRNKRIGKKEE